MNQRGYILYRLTLRIFAAGVVFFGGAGSAVAAQGTIHSATNLFKWFFCENLLRPKTDYIFSPETNVVRYAIKTEQGFQRISISQTGRTSSEMLKRKLMPAEWLNTTTLIGQKVLDAGAGGGDWVNELRSGGVYALGIDLHLNTETRSQPDVFFQMDMRKTDFADESFDVIYSIMSLATYKSFDHVVLRGLLKEFSRILKPNGVIRLSAVDKKTIEEVLAGVPRLGLEPLPKLKISQFAGPVDIRNRPDFGKDCVELKRVHMTCYP